MADLPPGVRILFERLTNVMENQHNYLADRRTQEREQRFKLRRDIPKISGATGQQLLDEFDEFEEVFAKTDPRTARDWALTLEEALTGRAKHVREFAILNLPGRGLYEATQERNAPDQV